MLRRFFGISAVLVFLAVSTSAEAQTGTLFRIGTGGIGGTYYPVGQTIAGIIGNPPGSRPCNKGGTCGVEGMTAVALTSLGSVANVAGIAEGRLEAGFVQSDVAFWAHSGAGIFEGKAPLKGLRVIASLYPESIHVVARQKSGINALEDLKGRAVSLGARTSGTLVDARIVLGLAGIDEKSGVKARYLSPDIASAKLIAGELDAFFAVAGFPSQNVSRVVASGHARVLPIDGPAVEIGLLEYGFLSRGSIPAGTYSNKEAIPTLNVNALMVVSERLPADIVYTITQSLWREESQRLLSNGHPKAKLVTLQTALDGIGIPLHAGAIRYYKEVGKLK